MGDGGDFFAGRGVVGVEGFVGLLRCSVNEMVEAAVVAVQPDEGVFWIFWGGAVFHGYEIFGDAHLLTLNLGAKAPRLMAFIAGLKPCAAQKLRFKLLPTAGPSTTPMLRFAKH